jgi:hypothetical protein
MATKYKFEITDLNYDSLVATCRTLASSYFPSWDFDNPNDLGRYVLDLFLHAVDRMLWLVNRWCGEFNIFTATERQNVEARAQSLGYPVRVLTASGGTVSMTFIPSSVARVVGARTIKVSCDGVDGRKVYVENRNTFTIGSLVKDIQQPFDEGESYTLNVVGTGNKFQEFAIDRAYVIDDSVSVTVDADPWTEVDNFGASGPTDKHFIVESFGDTQSRVIFGDGMNGAIPVNGSAIAITSRIGGGTRGNLLANTFTTVEASPQTVTIDSNSAFTGGADREDIERIRLLAPLRRRAYDRLVTILDVKTFAESLAGVERAKVYLTGKTVYVRVVPSGGGVPSGQLLTDVANAITPKLIMGYGNVVVAPAYVAVTITITGEALDGYVASEVAASVHTDILNRLNPVAKNDNGVYLNDFGKALNLDDIIYVVRQNGLLKPGFTVDAPTQAITLSNDQILIDTGSVVTVNVTGGTSLVTFTDNNNP